MPSLFSPSHRLSGMLNAEAFRVIFLLAACVSVMLSPLLPASWEDSPWFHLYSDEAQTALKSHPEVESYLASVGLTTLEALWDKAINNNPSRIVSTGYGGNDLTYGALNAMSNALAVRLDEYRQQVGEKEGQGRVLIMLPSSPEFLISLLAARKANLIPVIATASSDNAEVADRLKGYLDEVKPFAVIGTKMNADILGELTSNAELPGQMKDLNISATPFDQPVEEVQEAPKPLLIVSGLFGAVENLGAKQKVINTLSKAPGIGVMKKRPDDSESFRDIVHSGRSSWALKGSDNPNSIALMVFTSGTTGTGKAVAISHKNIMAALVQVHLQFEGVMPEHAVSFLPLPVGHIFGALVSVVLTPHLGGTVNFVINPKEERYLKEALEKGRPDMVFGVSRLYEKLLSGPYDLLLKKYYEERGAAFVVSGAAPTSADVRTDVKNKFGTELTEGYGMSESTGVLGIWDAGKSKVGYIPTPWTQIRLVQTGLPEELFNSYNTEYMKQLANGEYDEAQEGELLAAGPSVALAYYQREKATSGTFLKDSNGKIWLKTGDIAARNDDGSFSITGRAKETIIKGGKNISPDAVQQRIEKIEGVESAFVFRVPQNLESLGEDHIVALVKLQKKRRGQVALTSADIVRQMGRAGDQAEVPYEELVGIVEPDTIFPMTHILKPKRVQTTNAIVQVLKSQEGVNLLPDKGLIMRAALTHIYSAKKVR